MVRHGYLLVSEEELREWTRQKSVIERLRTCRWRGCGHVLRMPEERIPKEALEWRPGGRRRMGRPKDTWLRTIERERREKNLYRVYVEALAEDRSAWRRFVAGLWTTWGPKRIK